MSGESLSNLDQAWIMHPFSRPMEEGLLPVLTKGEGVWLYDSEGKRYLDASGSWWVNLHGHGHPYLNQKIKEQLEQLEHAIFSGFTHPQAVRLAGRLLHLEGAPKGKVFYSDNGSTAVEIALKLAWQYFVNQGISKKGFVALQGAYHGDTLGALATGERDVFVRPFESLLAPVEYIEPPGPQTDWESLKRFLEEKKPAAFIYEPLVQGAAGMRMYEAEPLKRLLGLCRELNILCIADEVLTGFGRTGTLLASEQCGTPDLMALSKGLTGGYLPMGATLISEHIAAEFHTDNAQKLFYHGHSYTANPLACAAANASLDILEQPETQAHMQWLYASLATKAEEWNASDHLPRVRVKGNIFAFDLASNYKGYFYNNPARKKIYAWCIAHELLMRPLGSVVYIIPPYGIQPDELDFLLDRLKTLAQTWPLKAST